ncbi:hypothetical protein LEP1GSC198_0694 [Leptospira kirschneri str. JB]|nr:hypothetical protein LEP1GSC198_0694 [Leptospira kirschneri str. JB]
MYVLIQNYKVECPNEDSALNSLVFYYIEINYKIKSPTFIFIFYYKNKDLRNEFFQ